MWEHLANSGCEVNEESQLKRVLLRFDYAQVVTLDGNDIGLLKAVQDTEPWELIQIQLMPEFQRRGIGERLLTELLDDARKAGVSVVLGVLRANPARSLYERLGFRVVGESDVAYRMRFDP